MSRQIDYHPIGQRVCHTTPEQMDQKLQKRLREVAAKALLKPGERVDSDTGEIHVQQSEPKPDGRGEPSAPRLVWLAKVTGAYHIETDCARYRVSGAKSQGTLRYSAWRCARVAGAMPDPLGCTDAPESAKQLCADHLASEAVKT